MQGLCFLSGTWISLDQATLPISDLAVVRGYGAFDYLRTYGKRPFHLEDHLIRFKRSADLLGLSIPYSFEEIETIIDQILEKTNYAETGIKLLLTGGISQDQFRLEGKPTFCVMAYPHQPLPSKCYQDGIHVVTTRHYRPLPQAKSTCYLPAIAALQQARPSRAADVLYVNSHGEILEASTANIFIVKKGRLITPHSEEILQGITREIAKRCALPDIPVVHAPLPLSELTTWEEAFLTSSNREVLPVVSIDDQAVGSGKVGPLTHEMLHRFKAYTQASEWPPLWAPQKVNK